MIPKNLAILLAFASAAVAAPSLRRSDECQDAYKQCIDAGTPEVACSCTLTACVGEDNARNREFCATATADLAKPTTLVARDDCQETYKQCIAAGTPEVACSCTLTACVGEDNARNREFCATATANLAKPTVVARDDCQATWKQCIAAGTPEVACSCSLARCTGEDNARNREFCATATANLAKPTTLVARDDCQETYKQCIAAGTPEVACSCSLTACLGEDNARNREFCATATASMAKPTTLVARDHCQDDYKQCISAGTPEVVCSCALATCTGEDNARTREFCATATESLAKRTETAVAEDDCQVTYKKCIADGTPEVACSCSLASCTGEDNARNREFCATATASLAKSTAAQPTQTAAAAEDECQTTYKKCLAAGTPEVACSCDLTACYGEDNARNREFCASATASLAKSTAAATSAPAFTSISGIPGGCNPAHPGSCPSSYFTYSTLATKVATAAPEFTSIAGIPGGCNPAHPGSCPSSYFSSIPAAPTAAPEQPAAPAGGSPSPKPIEGKTWTVEDMTRYCSEDNSGCDYNFAVNANGKTERCTVIRMPGANAAAESWYDVPCTSGSNLRISWGYAAEPAPAFAVMTVVNGEELAWFGISNVNEQEVSASNPFGSGQYGNIGPEQVYTH